MIALLALALLFSAGQDPKEDVPRACRPDIQGAVDWAACHAAAPEGSMARLFATINLGTIAYLSGDYGEAVRRYDEAVAAAGANQLQSDVWFHAFRADAYDHVGRGKEALDDARTAWAMLQGAAADWEARAGMAPLTDPERADVLSLILPILKSGGDPGFAQALAAYRALPTADWTAQAQRAAVLEQLGDFDGALAASREAMKARPGDPGLENNHCYILSRAGRPTEALPYCERAVAGLPDAAPIRHSMAAVLAQLGRCDESAAALAEAARLDPSGALYRQPIACAPR